MGVIPPHIGEALTAANRTEDLLEVILDLGRVPTARYVDSEVVLTPAEVTRGDIDYVVTRIGDFDADNRAGLERTLHRISGLRNRRGQVVGLTCRVGRAVYGTIDIIQDIVESGKSILLLGRPGIGKTTMLREAARTLAEKKRVVIVDTSNEIGGDGDVAHPAVGRARRMQVPKPSLQHEVMIEAVENHNPEVIVIDEIGRELEAEAARTIAERGVQLIGTAHGNSLENILLNPTLADLVGGIESVTLSDEEARRRGTQKTVLERRAPPTFDVLIEIQAREKLAVHHDVAQAVDAFLRGRPRVPELRYRNEAGEVQVEAAPAWTPARAERAERGERGGREPFRPLPIEAAAYATQYTSQYAPHTAPHIASQSAASQPESAAPAPRTPTSKSPLHLYAYGVARNRLEQAAKRLSVPARVVDDLNQAEALVTLKTYYRKHQRIVTDAEERGLPVYVLRANTVSQLEMLLSDLFDLGTAILEEDDSAAMAETQAAIKAVQTGSASVDLNPASAKVRRMQHELARDANLVSHSYGKEPYRRVRIFRD